MSQHGYRVEYSNSSTGGDVLLTSGGNAPGLSDAAGSEAASGGAGNQITQDLLELRRAAGADVNPEIIRKRTEQEVAYEAAIKYFKLQTPPPREILIREEKNIITPPPPPSVIRHQPRRPETPPLLNEIDVQPLALDRESLGEYKSWLARFGSSGSFGAAGVAISGSVGGAGFSSGSSTVTSSGNLNAILAELFASVDKNASGSISRSEGETLLLKLNSRLGRRYGEDEVNAFFRALDVNADGLISFAEFRNAILRQFA